MKKISQKFIYAASLISLAAVGCGGSGGKGSTVTSPGTYALTVTSVNPVSGLPLTVSRPHRLAAEPSWPGLAAIQQLATLAVSP